MAIEPAQRRLMPKPWGARDLRPWNQGADDGSRVGEVWYGRQEEGDDVKSTLLLKLLFTTAPLSIQVHPDDCNARKMGGACGKTEAWYILSAAPGAQVGLGLKRTQTAEQLRRATVDGSIEGLVAWRGVSAGDTIFVPAGTVHAIGGGLVIAEIQQRSDATFRLFDHGRDRELHIDSAIAVAHAAPAVEQPPPLRLDDERTLLVRDQHFIFERLQLQPVTEWSLRAELETWLLIIGGSGSADGHEVRAGDAVFAKADLIDIVAGASGLECLVAYAGALHPLPNLLAPASPRNSSASTVTREVAPRVRTARTQSSWASRPTGAVR